MSPHWVQKHKWPMQRSLDMVGRDAMKHNRQGRIKDKTMVHSTWQFSMSVSLITGVLLGRNHTLKPDPEFMLTWWVQTKYHSFVFSDCTPNALSRLVLQPL